MTIENPWHSRPLDVHRWSDHPEAMALSDGLWDEYFADLSNEGRPGPKPKTAFRHQFRVVLLGLWVAWTEDPDLSLGVAMGETAWHPKSRYNALNISKKIRAIVHRLHDLGLIDLAKGSHGGPLSLTNRTTRIRATDKLRARFEASKVKSEMVVHHPDREVIILKDGDESNAKSKPIEYEDTNETKEMRRRLRAYNALLARTFIDKPILDNPYFERKVTSGPGVGQIDRVSTLPTKTFVRRIFSRGSWDLNGRFYGGWWQQVDRKTRSRIFLNDVPTIEVDFKGLHVAILSNEKGVPIEGDPYSLPENTVAGVEPKL